MRVGISTVGRFHLFALARELLKEDALEYIATGLPWSAVARERVPREYVRNFPWLRPAVIALNKAQLPLTGALEDRAHYASAILHDLAVAQTLGSVDVFVGHEAAGLSSGVKAQSRGAIYVCDRGCSHMAYREALLSDEYARIGLPRRSRPATYQRELDEYKAADLIVVPSTFARESFIVSGVAASKVTVVPYGAEPGRDADDSIELPSGFNILFAGGLSIRKGARDLFEAFEAVSGQYTSLHIAGIVSREAAQVLGSRLHNERVHQHGHLSAPQLRGLMRRCDVLVLPSIEDGFGMVITEAMSCGCPVIATRNTGAPDVVTDGVDGFIVPIRAPEQIAAKLALLISDSTRARFMGAAAAAAVDAAGGWSRYATEMIGAYRRAILARQSAPVQ